MEIISGETELMMDLRLSSLQEIPLMFDWKMVSFAVAFIVLLLRLVFLEFGAGGCGSEDGLVEHPRLPWCAWIVLKKETGVVVGSVFLRDSFVKKVGLEVSEEETRWRGDRLFVGDFADENEVESQL